MKDHPLSGNWNEEIINMIEMVTWSSFRLVLVKLWSFFPLKASSDPDSIQLFPYVKSVMVSGSRSVDGLLLVTPISTECVIGTSGFGFIFLSSLTSKSVFTCKGAVVRSTPLFKPLKQKYYLCPSPLIKYVVDKMICEMTNHYLILVAVFPPLDNATFSPHLEWKR